MEFLRQLLSSILSLLPAARGRQRGTRSLSDMRIGAASQPPQVDENMPQILKNQLLELESWARANERDARRDTLRFWMLKIPAIVASASAGVFAFFEWETVNVVAGAVASLCVLIDGLNPGGTLRNVHLRAQHDLRNLQNTLITQWRIGDLREEVGTDELVAQIVENIHLERQRIATYLRDAETMLGEGQSS